MQNTAQDQLIRELGTCFNDSNRYYRTGSVEKTSSPHEEVQVRLNNILQNRKQISENLSGSQISYILDFYIKACFSSISWPTDLSKSKMLELLKKSYIITLDKLIANRRKLMSTRFSNEEIYDTLVKLLFETDADSFVKNLFSLRLNRGVYLEFLDRFFNSQDLKSSAARNYFEFFKEGYFHFKGLLLGNYLRFIMTETNKFTSQYKDHLEVKEDYFCGLILVVLNVIDKYDSYKGTLTSYIENWFKDYRTVFSKNNVFARFNEKAITAENENYLFSEIAKSSEESSNLELLEDEEEMLDSLIDRVYNFTGGEPGIINEIVENNISYFPEISKILAGKVNE